MYHSNITGNTAYVGGGVYNRQGSTVVQDSIIADNTAFDQGGGITQQDGTLTITRSLIRDNRQTRGGDSRGGGGVYIAFNAVVTIRESALDQNHAEGSNNGHQIMAYKWNSQGGAPAVTVVNTRFIPCTACETNGTNFYLHDYDNTGNSGAAAYGTLSRKTCSDSPCTVSPFTGACVNRTDDPDHGVTCAYSPCGAGTHRPSVVVSESELPPDAKCTAHSTSCSAGNFLGNGSATTDTCAPCPGGQYQPNNSFTGAACTAHSTSCDAGNFLGISSATTDTCATCPGGKYQPNNSFTGAACTTCPSGQYQPLNEGAACAAHSRACDAGNFLSTGSVTADTCTVCPGGQYQPNNSSTGVACMAHSTACDVGNFLGNGSATTDTCATCPSGQYQPNNSFTGAACTAHSTSCDAGNFLGISSATTDTCATCPGGKYQPNNSFTGAACTAHSTACDAGNFLGIGSATADTCTACPGGQHQPANSFTGAACGGDKVEAKLAVSLGSGSSVALSDFQTSGMQAALAANIATTLGVSASQCTIIAIYECPGDRRCTSSRRRRRELLNADTTIVVEFEVTGVRSEVTGVTRALQNPLFTSVVTPKIQSSVQTLTGKTATVTVARPLVGRSTLDGSHADPCPLWGTFDNTSRACVACRSGTFRMAYGGSQICEFAEGHLCPVGHSFSSLLGNLSTRCAPCDATAGYSPFFTTATQCPARDVACAGGRYTVREATAATGPVCALCSAGMFYAAPQQACQTLRVCQAGTFVQHPGSPSADRACQACPHGQYAPESNTGSCRPWASCGHREVLRDGDARTDRRCAAPANATFRTLACPPGTFKKLGDLTRLGFPGAGVDSLPGVVQDGTAGTDRRMWNMSARLSKVSPAMDAWCEPCPLGTFSETVGQHACVPVRTCSINTYPTIPPRATLAGPVFGESSWPHIQGWVDEVRRGAPGHKDWRFFARFDAHHLRPLRGNVRCEPCAERQGPAYRLGPSSGASFAEYEQYVHPQSIDFQGYGTGAAAKGTNSFCGYYPPSNSDFLTVVSLLGASTLLLLLAIYNLLHKICCGIIGAKLSELVYHMKHDAKPPPPATEPSIFSRGSAWMAVDDVVHRAGQGRVKNPTEVVVTL